MVAATSAAVVHGLPVMSGMDRPIVSSPLSHSARTIGVRTLRHSFTLPSQPWYSVRIATLVLLPRFLDPSSVERCIDHCIANRLITADRVLRLIDELPATALTGRRYLVDLLEQRLGGVGHRSRTEQRVARWLTAAGLTGWLRNYDAPVEGGQTVEVDFAWPLAKVALEVSPFFTHGSKATQERDVERRRLLVLAGWRVIEATDPDLHSERTFGRTLATLRSLLKHGDVCAIRDAERDVSHNLGSPRRAG
jgi:very-short-patch-repair endonuclease